MMMIDAMEEIEDGIKVGGKLVKDVRFADDQGLVVIHSSLFSSVGCADDEALTRLFQTSFLCFWSLYQSW